LALIASRTPGDFRGNGRVAIPIGPNPRAKSAKRIPWGFYIGVTRLQCRPKALLQQRHGLEQHLLKVMKGKFHFIQHGWLELVQFIRSPPEANFLFELFAQEFLIILVSGFFKPINQGRHFPLFVAHGVAHNLCGMGRKNKPNI
jgi:hypothetical protein